MNLRTLVIDDEPITLEKLRSYVEKTPFLTLSAAFDNPLDALDFLASNTVDLIFTDIDMPDLNGMDFVKNIADPPAVVFTTAYEQYAVDSYSVRAVDYLLKPYSLADFTRAANRALEARKLRAEAAPITPRSLFIKTDTRHVRVNLDDIIYIKGYGEYLQLYIRERTTPLLTLSSFNVMKQYLTPNFLQVHRSFIVNMDCAEMIERNHIITSDKASIPVSDSFKPAFQEYLSAHVVGKSRQ